MTGMAIAESPKMLAQTDAIPLTVVGELRDPAVAHYWMAVACCPSCGSTTRTAEATLSDGLYAFGTERVAFPEQGVKVIECGGCGLFYKSMVPTPAYLADVIRRQGEAKWTVPHDFRLEVMILKLLNQGKAFDLLDVGAAGGSLLEACAASSVTERRAALDVMRYAGIERHLAGEFIEGFLDDPVLTWGHEPYDVVTLFDVLEHLYQPRIAFENLRSLVRRDGLVYLETGNAGSFWPRRLGISQWWYVRLLEHHVFWSRAALAYAAAEHGFRIVFWREGRHKSRRGLSPAAIAGDLLKTALYFVTGAQYAGIAHVFGKQGNQPWYPFARDHFQACLVRE